MPQNVPNYTSAPKNIGSTGLTTDVNEAREQVEALTAWANTVTDFDPAPLQALVAALQTSKLEVWTAGGPKYAATVYLLIGGIGSGFYQPKNDLSSSGSVSLTYYNRLLALPTLYTTTGTNTDGGMTQKATTEALGLKADLTLVNAGWVRRQGTTLTTYTDAVTAINNAASGTTTEQQTQFYLGSAPATLPGGVFNLRGNVYQNGATLTLQPGSRLAGGGGVYFQNGGNGLIQTSVSGGGSGYSFGEIVITGLRIGVGIDVAANTKLILDTSTFFGAGTITYSGTLVIHANCDLGGKVPVAVPVAGQPAPVLTDYRASTGSAPTTGIDYANPVTLSAAATLTANTAYYVTGAGYTLTLPSASDNLGKAIFISIASSATGLYPVSGAGTLAMYAAESMLVRATADGWKKTGGELLAMSARLETLLSQQDSVSQNTAYKVPLGTGIGTPSLPGMVDAAANSLVVARAAKGDINAFVAIKNATPGGNYVVFVQVTDSAGGSVRYPVQDTVAVDRTGVGFLAQGFKHTFAAGDRVALYFYNEDSCNLRGTNPGSQCSLTYTETV